MARYPSGKGEVCKTFMRRFDSDPRLHLQAVLKSDIAHCNSEPNHRTTKTNALSHKPDLRRHGLTGLRKTLLNEAHGFTSCEKTNVFEGYGLPCRSEHPGL
jgi:hypothetical protein